MFRGRRARRLQETEHLAKARLNYDALSEESRAAHALELKKMKDAEWASIDQREHDTGTLFDKYVITIATGGVALSIGFVKDHPTVVGIPDLVTGIYCLMSSAILIVISFLSGQYSLRKQAALNEIYFGDPVLDRRPKNRLSTTTEWIRFFAGTALAIGILLTVRFGITAINDMPEKKILETTPSTKQTTAESFVPPIQNKPAPPAVATPKPTEPSKPKPSDATATTPKP